LVEYRLTVQPLRKDERPGRRPHPKAAILDPTSRRRARTFYREPTA
jgi:hypothetical protein